VAWAPDYAVTADLAAYERIGDSADDAQLALAITGASRAIDHATNRQFGVTAATEERTYDACWSPSRSLYVADIDDVMTAVGLVVTVSGSALASSAYELTPTNAAAKSRPWTRIATASATSRTLGTGPPQILVEATWGWTAVPDTIKQATLLQASRFFTRREAPFGVAGSPDIGSELRLLAKVDPDVAVMVQSYRRNWPMVS